MEKGEGERLLGWGERREEESYYTQLGCRSAGRSAQPSSPTPPKIFPSGGGWNGRRRRERRVSKEEQCAQSKKPLPPPPPPPLFTRCVPPSLPPSRLRTKGGKRRRGFCFVSLNSFSRKEDGENPCWPKWSWLPVATPFFSHS